MMKVTFKLLNNNGNGGCNSEPINANGNMEKRPQRRHSKVNQNRFS